MFAKLHCPIISMVEIKEVGESSRPSDENEADMNEEIVEQSNGEVW